MNIDMIDVKMKLLKSNLHDFIEKNSDIKYQI
jgi:hypothetical protein